MSNSAIDFSDSVADIEKAEKELFERRKKRSEAAKNTPEKVSLESKPNTESGRGGDNTPKPERKPREPKRPAPFPVQVVPKQRRVALTLKVLEEKAERFHELFHLLKAMKDSRTKQELADESLDLLLERYKKVIP